MIKRLAFECPISSISDTFYILFTKYVSLPLSKITPEEDEISAFFKLSESQAGIMNVPIGVEADPSNPNVRDCSFQTCIGANCQEKKPDRPGSIL